jgi:cobyrinic acid a,c-diamide synthase
VLVGEELVAPLLLHGARGADVAVVEGVMGLFDGRGATDDGSTAHVARLLDAPVVLVVDASSQSRSVAALVQGFAHFDARVRLGGVVLNRVGSDRHEALLREALDGVAPVLGVLRRDAGVATPSRHLGLVPAAERAPDAVATVRRLGELCAQSLDLDALLELARSAPALDAEPWTPPTVQREHRPVVAVAGGEAFTFSYAETVELLTAAGADVVVVDPLRDERLPAGTAGARARRRVPGGVRRAAVGERDAARRRPAAGRERGAHQRRVRRAALPVRGARRAADVRRAAGGGSDDRAADARLPHDRRRRPRSRVPPHGGRAARRGAAGVAGRGPPGGLRAGRRARQLPARALGRLRRSAPSTSWTGPSRRLVAA